MTISLATRLKIVYLVLFKFLGKEIHFNAEGSEVLRLSQNGFHYKGQTIDDAGEAYRLFMDWLNNAQEQEL